MAFYKWDEVSSDNLYGSALNDNFGFAGARLFDSDTTGGSGGAGSFSKMGSTLSVAAADCEDHIWVVALLYSSGTGSIADTLNTDFDIRIGETGSVVSKYTHKHWQDAVDRTSADPRGMTSTVSFYYAPTTDEKTNGFDVEIYGKSGGSGSDNIKSLKVYVFGG